MWGIETELRGAGAKAPMFYLEVFGMTEVMP
jgi:hypothetical protein